MNAVIKLFVLLGAIFLFLLIIASVFWLTNLAERVSDIEYELRLRKTLDITMTDDEE